MIGTPTARATALISVSPRSRWDLVVARLATHAGEAVGEHPAAQIFGELAIDVAWQAASVGIAELGDRGLRVARDQLVQHRVLGRASLVAVSQRLSGRAGRSFVESAREHPRVVKFRATFRSPEVAHLPRTCGTLRPKVGRRRLGRESSPVLRASEARTPTMSSPMSRPTMEEERCPMSRPTIEPKARTIGPKSDRERSNRRDSLPNPRW